MSYNNIIIFSPPRTGSTLIYNLVKSVKKSHQNVFKEHNFRYNISDFFIITLRHPYNSIISCALKEGDTITDDNINTYINEYLNNGGYNIPFIDMNRDNILFLYYEEFAKDITYVVDILTDKLSLQPIGTSDMDILKGKLDIDNVMELTANYTSFQIFNPDNHYHGHHISKYKGNTDYKEILDDKHIDIFKNNLFLKKILDKYYQ